MRAHEGLASRARACRPGRERQFRIGQPDHEGPAVTDAAPGRSNLSDKALAVFAFALYHQLEGGEPVSRVVLRDGAGHQADDQAVAELRSAGLAEVDGNWIVFSDDGLRRIAALAEAARGSAA